QLRCTPGVCRWRTQVTPHPSTPLCGEKAGLTESSRTSAGIVLAIAPVEQLCGLRTMKVAHANSNSMLVAHGERIDANPKGDTEWMVFSASSRSLHEPGDRAPRDVVPPGVDPGVVAPEGGHRHNIGMNDLCRDARFGDELPRPRCVEPKVRVHQLESDEALE